MTQIFPDVIVLFDQEHREDGTEEDKTDGGRGRGRGPYPFPGPRKKWVVDAGHIGHHTASIVGTTNVKIVVDSFCRKTNRRSSFRFPTSLSLSWPRVDVSLNNQQHGSPATRIDGWIGPLRPIYGEKRRHNPAFRRGPPGRPRRCQAVY